MGSKFDLATPGADPSLWLLEPGVTFLNHGSFGSCPRPVLEFQQSIREQMERQPVRFFVRELEGLLDHARQVLAEFVGAEAEDLVFVPNATAGVNTVLRSLSFTAEDELLVTDHEYNACRNALDYVAAVSGASVRVITLPFPLRSAQCVEDAVLGGISQRTRLLLIDHVTSQTGLILPIERLATELAERGIDLLVDGAHAPGMIPLELSTLRAAFYTGNCHKWLCAPKGTGFLYVNRERQASIRPLAISHGANSLRRDRSRFQIEFGWTGTWDASAVVAVPEALRFMERLLPGGWMEVMERNHSLAVAARRLLCDRLALPAPSPESMIGSLASVPLQDAAEVLVPISPLYADPLQDDLRNQFGIEVPIIPWPAPPRRVLRISAQLYNSLPQYQRLAEGLVALACAK